MSTSPAHTSQQSGVLSRLRGGLVVSCQALPGEPLFGPVFMTAMAATAARAGAVAVRVNGLADIEAVRSAKLGVPIIGLWKDGEQGVYITPTLEHALAVAAAGADIVALDATARPRPDGLSLAETIAAVHSRTGALVMADVATCEEGRAAAEAGADLVGTTLSGYTENTIDRRGADLDLVQHLAAALDIPVFAEGRIGTPDQAAEALRRGAWAVVVGGAITRPGAITSGFVARLAERHPS
ncbi:MAG: N-acetylmannosamine-6-phosphate 2-epimerase [Propionicimonas sp.]